MNRISDGTIIHTFTHSNSNSNTLLYQTLGVHVQGESSKQLNSCSDISFGKGLPKVYTGRKEVGGGGGGGGQQKRKYKVKKNKTKSEQN